MGTIEVSVSGTLITLGAAIGTIVILISMYWNQGRMLKNLHLELPRRGR